MRPSCPRAACCCSLCCGAALPVLFFCLPALEQLLEVGSVDRTMLPWDLLHLVVYKGQYQRRVLGRTPAGDPGAYREVQLTEEQRAQYFRDGYVILRNVLPPNVLDEIRADLWREIGPASWPWAHSTFMTVDSVLDLYLFSSLPAIAAQIFGSPGTDCGERVEGEPDRSQAHFYSDFHYFRQAFSSKVVEYHTDSNECEGTLPANHTKTSRLRMWLSLDDDVLPPFFINQSFLVSHMNETLRKAFWEGKGRGTDGTMMVKLLQNTSGFPSLEDPGTWTIPPVVHRGDVVLHTPCLVHTSPPPHGRHVAFLCLTYAPGESRLHTDWGAGAPFRSCKRELQIGDRIDSKFDKCVPQVYPRVVQKSEVFDYEVQEWNPLGAMRAWRLWRSLKVDEIRRKKEERRVMNRAS